MRLGLLSLAIAACTVSYLHGRHVERFGITELLLEASEAWVRERAALWVGLVNADPGAALALCRTDYECETAEAKAEALATTTMRMNWED